MKVRILSIIAFLALSTSSPAQTAIEVLDNTARAIRNAKGIQANFEATTFKGTTEQGNASGIIYLKNEKFKITSPEGNIWFDGKTQWSLYTNSDEVNVSNPTPEELQSINPYTFVNLYKNGYNATMWGTTYQGIDCHEIRLIAIDKAKALQEMRIIIDKKSLLPYSIRLKQKNDWFRARTSHIKTQNKWNDDFFRFDPNEYPNCEVIDLR